MVIQHLATRDADEIRAERLRLCLDRRRSEAHA